VVLDKVGGSLGFTLRQEDNSVLGHYVRALVKEPALTDGRIQPGDRILSVRLCYKFLEPLHVSCRNKRRNSAVSFRVIVAATLIYAMCSNAIKIISGQRERFIRFESCRSDKLSSTMSYASDTSALP